MFFLIWQVSYLFVLSPSRVPDKALTDVTTNVSAAVLGWFYPNVSVIYSDKLAKRQDMITRDGKKIIAVGDACNALEIYVLYVAFLFCFPAKLKKRLLFMLIGLPYIFCINIARVVAITYLNMYHRGWVDISHHYIFTILVYLLVFYLWMLFTRKTPTVGQS